LIIEVLEVTLNGWFGHKRNELNPGFVLRVDYQFVDW